MLQRLFEARTYYGSGPVLVSYGDTLIDLELERLHEAHERFGGLVTLVTSRIQNPFGILRFGQDSEIVSFEEKPVFDYYIGSFVFDPQAFELLSPGMLEAPDGKGLVALFGRLAERGLLRGFRHEGLNLTYNTPQDFENASTMALLYFTVGEDKGSDGDST